MIILYFADFRDYQNFAPVFGAALVIIMIASVTLIPALFALFGRKKKKKKKRGGGGGEKKKKKKKKARIWLAVRYCYF